MKIFRYLSLSLVVSCAIGVFAQAKTFSNQFIEFQLPDKWECLLDGTEWVCQSQDEQKKRDAIIVLAAKIRKPGMDDLPVYKAHLEQKLEHTTPSGEKVVSEPKFVKEIDIAGQKWIDALHLQSELPDFFTRYLATVVSDLGVLVTFSVRKDKYNEYSADIDAMIKSLRAFRKAGALNDDPNAVANEAPAAGAEDAGASIYPADGPKKKTGPSENDIAIFMGVVAAAGIGLFIFIKKRRKKS